MPPNLTPSLAADTEPRAAGSVRRYPVQLGLSYKLLRGGRTIERGLGKTREFSDGKVKFCADRILPSGVDSELSMDWPLRIHGTCPLQLVVFGRVIESGVNGSTLRITRFEFRPRSRQAVASRERVRTSGFQVHVGAPALHAQRG